MRFFIYLHCINPVDEIIIIIISDLAFSDLCDSADKNTRLLLLLVPECFHCMCCVFSYFTSFILFDV